MIVQFVLSFIWVARCDEAFGKSSNIEGPFSFMFGGGLFCWFLAFGCLYLRMNGV